DDQQKCLAEDFLTPLVRRAALTDVPSWLSPRPVRHARGRALEEAWARYLVDKNTGETGALDLTLKDLRDGERRGHIPSLAFTPMIIEDGRRVILSNLDLRGAIRSDGAVFTSRPSRQILDTHCIDAIELFRLFPGAVGKLKLATAARM